jgi:hypothetical protein
MGDDFTINLSYVYNQARPKYRFVELIEVIREQDGIQKERYKFSASSFDSNYNTEEAKTNTLPSMLLYENKMLFFITEVKEGEKGFFHQLYSLDFETLKVTKQSNFRPIWDKFGNKKVHFMSQTLEQFMLYSSHKELDQKIF